MKMRLVFFQVFSQGTFRIKDGWIHTIAGRQKKEGGGRREIRDNITTQ